MFTSWSSTFPPGPNQARPLWANEGHAFWKTKMIIPAISANTRQANAPSASSARWSTRFLTPADCRPPGRRIRSGRRTCLLVQWDPLRSDDLLRRAALLHPMDERDRRLRLVATSDRVEVPKAAVLAGLGVP